MLAQWQRFCHPLFAGLGIAFLLVTLPAKSDPFAASQAGQANARMRLIAAGIDHGTYRAAAEISLSPTAITYWRAPGEAGVPPKFSISGSQNVANATVLFPAPQRINEQGIEAFGYRGGVTFPIHVAPQDAAKPVRLHLTIDYAVCDNICVPVRNSAELVLPQSGEGPQAADVGRAEALVPTRLAPKEASAMMVLTPNKSAANPTWFLAWKGDFVPSDLFAEAPEGWTFETRRRSGRLFAITAVEEPASMPSRVPLDLTLTAPHRSYEFVLELTPPTKPATPAASAEEQAKAPGSGTK